MLLQSNARNSMNSFKVFAFCFACKIH